MTILEALVQLRNDLKLWVANNLRVKVDKEDGKGLSSNDFTNEEKEKLAGIPMDSIATEAYVEAHNTNTEAHADIRATLSEALLLKNIPVAMPTEDSWHSIAYGNGTFVAIAKSSDAVVYSTDGITWTATTMPSYSSWVSIVYGNNKFVAIAGSSDIAAYSEDGITWTSTTMPNSGEWISVTYGNGKFVAVSQFGNPAYSTDGVIWASATMPNASTVPWQAVTYGNNKFIAVTQNTADIACSDDGVTWSTVQNAMPTSLSGMGWDSIAYGDGKFISVSDSGDIAYSEDGIAWADAGDLPALRSLSSEITYGNGKFVVVESDININATSDTAFYSTDGIAWTATTMPSSEYWQSVAYGGDRFVAISYGEAVAYSTDGITWSGNAPYLSDTDGTDITEEALSALGAATKEEVNAAIDGVTSSIQAQLDGKVPTTRKVNNKALSADVTLTAADVGAFAKNDDIGMNKGDPLIFPTTASGATRLRLYSGRDAAYDGGAGLILTNKNATTSAGSFTLTAHDGTNSAALSGTPSGALSWKGNLVYHQGNKPTAADIGAAPSGFGLGTTAKVISNTDLLDTLTTGKTGWYRGQNVTNAPSTAWYFFMVVAESASYSYVLAFRYGGGIFKASYGDNGFSGWSELYGEHSKPTAADVGAATTTTYDATVTTSWTADGSYYKQDITITGITASDNPIVAIKTGTDNAANKLYQESLSKVIRIVTAADKITVYATEKISTAFPIQLKVVR